MPPRPKPKTALGKRLLAIRDNLDLTQEEAGDRIGITRQSWARWELGSRKPDKSHLILIALLEQGKL